MGTYDTVIFDLDGTLLNTLEDLADSVNAALEKYHCPQKTLEQIRTYVGNGIRNLIACSLENGEEHPEFENVFQAFRTYYMKNCQNKTKPYEGIMELLRELKSQGKKLAIVSNKADFAVKELNEYYFKEFDMLAVGEREEIAKKPAADMVYHALKQLKAEKEQAIYIGDSEVDIQTAENAGIPCISVLWGFRKKEFLQKHGGKYFAKNAKEVLSILEKSDYEEN